MSEPQSSGALAVEMAGLDVIPESDRKGRPADLFMPWFAANISVLGISWGSWVLGFGLSLIQAVVVSVVGVSLSFLVCGLIAIAGKRGSAPTLVLSRAAFGFNGNRVSAAISCGVIAWRRCAPSIRPAQSWRSLVRCSRR